MRAKTMETLAREERNLSTVARTIEEVLNTVLAMRIADKLKRVFGGGR